jgi:AcrR family transcriptional regulator
MARKKLDDGVDDAEGKRLALSPVRIVAAAIEIMDANGVSGLTMRGLGAKLSVKAMSLYRYFPSRDHLLEAAGDTLFAAMRDPEPEADPLEGIRQVMVAFYRLVESHPCIVELMFSGPQVAAFGHRGDRDRAALVEAGFTDDAHLVLQGLVAFTVGAVQQRRRSPPAVRQTVFELGLDMMLSGLRLEAEKRAIRAATPL